MELTINILRYDRTGTPFRFPSALAGQKVVESRKWKVAVVDKKLFDNTAQVVDGLAQ